MPIMNNGTPTGHRQRLSANETPCSLVRLNNSEDEGKETSQFEHGLIMGNQLYQGNTLLGGTNFNPAFFRSPGFAQQQPMLSLSLWNGGTQQTNSWMDADTDFFSQSNYGKEICYARLMQNKLTASQATLLLISCTAAPSSHHEHPLLLSGTCPPCANSRSS